MEASLSCSQVVVATSHPYCTCSVLAIQTARLDEWMADIMSCVLDSDGASRRVDGWHHVVFAWFRRRVSTSGWLTSWSRLTVTATTMSTVNTADNDRHNQRLLCLSSRWSSQSFTSTDKPSQAASCVNKDGCRSIVWLTLYDNRSVPFETVARFDSMFLMHQ